MYNVCHWILFVRFPNNTGNNNCHSRSSTSSNVSSARCHGYQMCHVKYIQVDVLQAISNGHAWGYKRSSGQYGHNCFLSTDILEEDHTHKQDNMSMAGCLWLLHDPCSPHSRIQYTYSYSMSTMCLHHKNASCIMHFWSTYAWKYIEALVLIYFFPHRKS